MNRPMLLLSLLAGTGVFVSSVSYTRVKLARLWYRRRRYIGAQGRVFGAGLSLGRPAAR
jgi:hypothetical protein